MEKDVGVDDLELADGTPLRDYLKEWYEAEQETSGESPDGPLVKEETIRVFQRLGPDVYGTRLTYSVVLSELAKLAGRYELQMKKIYVRDRSGSAYGFRLLYGDLDLKAAKSDCWTECEDGPPDYWYYEAEIVVPEWIEDLDEYDVRTIAEPKEDEDSNPIAIDCTIVYSLHLVPF